MTCVHDLYDNLLNCKEQWSYYDFNFDDFTQQQSLGEWVMANPYKFLKEMVKRGGKDTISCVEQIGALSLMRKQHTVSCFLLGNFIYNKCCHLQKCIDNTIESIPSGNKDENTTKRFRYMWMIISVFHDLGYQIEESECDFIKESEVRKAFTNIKKQSIIALQPPYSKDMASHYYKFRKEKWNCIDHGIAGGSLLYRDLCKLRKDKVAFYGGDYGTDGLYWGEELEKDFLYSAWTIACHNIYKILPYDENEEYYRKFKLTKLISYNKLIDKERMPLLYLLCLVDSIEPIKLVKNDYLLDNIFIDIIDNNIVVDLTRIKDWKIQLGYLGKLKALNTWLTKVDVKNKSCAIISL